MSVITHNSKIVLAPNGKSLNFDNLIALANATTGASDKTLTSAMNSLISKYVFHTMGTVDYRGYNAGATITVPYTRPERNVLLMARCVGIWYKNADSEWELSDECDFSLTGDTATTPVPMTFILLSPSIQNPGFNFKSGNGNTVWMRNLASCEVAANLVSISGTPVNATFASGTMTFNATTLSHNITNGHRFASTKFGTRYQYHIYAWRDST